MRRLSAVLGLALIFALTIGPAGAASTTGGATPAGSLATSTPKPALPAVQLHQPMMEPCAPGTGIVVSPAGMASFTAKSIAFGGSASVDSMASHRSGKVTIVKQTDAASKPLMDKETNGALIPSITVMIYKGAGGATHDTIVTLTNATVVGFVERRTTPPTEDTVTLGYQALTSKVCGG